MSDRIGVATLVLLAGVVVGGCSSSEDETVSDTNTPVADADATSADADAGPPPGCFTLKDGKCVVETFANPPTLAPNADGVYELELVPGEFLVNGERHCGRTYNGMFPAPTIDTPARVGETPRQVRVNIRNRFTRADYQPLGSGECTCTDAAGAACEPTHGAHTDCACKDAEGETCHVFDFNVTNLHAHGSHVRPDYATGGGCVEKDGLGCRVCSGDTSTGARECFFADDVISRVEAGEGAQHRWDIDEDGTHHEGLDWYHPHIHGSTAIQVASGATGAWIIRGPVDELPGIKKARERVFVIMTPPVTYEPLADGQVCDEDHITFNGFFTLGDTKQKQTNLLNGVRQPRLVMAPGQIERWRFLHGSFLDEMTLAIFRGKDSDCKELDFQAGPVALTQIGRDGVTLPKPASGVDWPYAPDYLFLAPGYRIDAMLDGGAFADGDTLCMMSARFLQEDTTGRTDLGVGLTEVPTADEILQSLTNGDLIAIVNVAASAGAPTETQMPDLAEVATHVPTMMLKGGTVDALAKCEQAQAETDVAKIDQVSALWLVVSETEGLDQCACPDHNINCKNFESTDRERYPYDRVFQVGAVDHWRLFSGFDGHPFHIHINPFLVCPLPEAGTEHRNTKSRLFEPAFAHWRDTYLVNLDRTVDIVTEYRTHTGAYVFHCHKLTHEDHGMMELVSVCDPAKESCDTLCSGGRCAWNSCAEGDDDCLRALTGTQCLLDPTRCAEAALRCKPCDGAAMSCPPNAHCSGNVNADGQQRCAPGCVSDSDCAAVDACEGGDCAPAPCMPPCSPGTACVHGACQ